MKKIDLPINENPELISYTHNAYISAILGSEIIGGDIAAKYEIISNHAEYKKIEEECVATLGKEVIVKTNNMKDQGYSLIYDACKEKESFIVKVNFRRKISSREHICIVLDEAENINKFNPDECLTRFGSPSGLRLIVKRKDKYLEEKSSKRILSMGYYLKLDKDGLLITYSYSEDGKHWSKVYEETLPKRYEIIPLNIGVIVETKNDYMNWKISNYVQMYMKYPGPNDIMIDYYLGPTKHYKPYASNHVFDVYFDYLEYYNYSSKKIANYIYQKFQESSYIIANIDHYYVPQSVNYRKYKHYHEVLIYGVDFSKKNYKIMAYGENNNVIIEEISFNDFWKSLDPNQIMFVVYKINLNYNRYEINTKIISRRLKEYLDGINSEEAIADIVPGQDVITYGINILKYLTDKEDDLYIFCNDNRLSYTIFEHRRLMFERFEYLQNNNVLKQDIPEDIWEGLRRDLELSEIVKNNILMSTMGNNKKSTMEKIRNYLLEMISIEEKCYNKLCLLLEE